MDNYQSQTEILGGNESFFSDAHLSKTVCFFCYLEDTETAVKTTKALAEIYSRIYKPTHAYSQAVHDLDFVCQELDGTINSKEIGNLQKTYRKAVDYDNKVNVKLN